MSDAPEVIYKFLIVGPPGVGKTCLIRRYVHGVYTSGIAATVMVDFSMKVVAQSNRTVNLRLWDIQGQEQPGYLGRTYYGGAVGALVVADCTKPATLDDALLWKADISSKVFLPAGGTTQGSGNAGAVSANEDHGDAIPCILCLNKCDTPGGLPKSKAELNDFCEKNGFMGWVATSGMKDIGITPAFDQLIGHVDRALPSGEEDEEAGSSGGVKLGKDRQPRKKKTTEKGCKC